MATRTVAPDRLARPDLPAPRVPGDADTIRDRVVAATLVCVARHGVAKTTVDDIAREAGCARASVYRQFGSRAELVACVMLAELDRVADEVELAVLGAPDLGEAIVAFLAECDRQLREHAAFQFVLAHEPELLLPFLAFEPGRCFLRAVRDRLGPGFERFFASTPAVDAATEAGRVAEWCARIVLAHPDGPARRVDLSDPAATRDFVRNFVLPAFDHTQGVPQR